MTTVSLLNNSVILINNKVGTDTECCCSDSSGICCVDGVCDDRFKTKEACELCETILGPGGFPIGTNGPCGIWIAGGKIDECNQVPWKCDLLPRFHCINGLPPEWNSLKQLDGTSSTGTTATDTLYLQVACGRWKIVGVISRPWIPDVIGFNEILPPTPDGQCFPDSADIQINADRNTPGFPMNVTITFQAGMC